MQECIKERTHLLLVHGEALAGEASSARVPSLDAQPFRPGELPESVLVELGAAARLVEDRAAHAGIPAGLWLRLGVEAVRHVEELAEALDLPPTGVLEALDSALEDVPSLAPLEARRQRAYAQQLRAANSSGSRRPHMSRYSLAIPDYMVAAWSIAAAEAAMAISTYVATIVKRVPPRVAEWEAAAAERGQPLAEWIYAVGLRALKER